MWSSATAASPAVPNRLRRMRYQTRWLPSCRFPPADAIAMDQRLVGARTIALTQTNFTAPRRWRRSSSDSTAPACGSPENCASSTGTSAPSSTATPTQPPGELLPGLTAGHCACGGPMPGVRRSRLPRRGRRQLLRLDDALVHERHNKLRPAGQVRVEVPPFVGTRRVVGASPTPTLRSRWATARDADSPGELGSTARLTGTNCSCWRRLGSLCHGPG